MLDKNLDIERYFVVVCYLHDSIIDASGGIKGVHSEHLLKSALSRPYHTAFGEDMYGDVFTKAAAILDSIANNHSFRDGNKRTAMAAASLFLYLNEDKNLQFTNGQYEEFMLHVVNDKPPIKEIAQWLRDHI